MSSEYEPLFAEQHAAADLNTVQELFRAASGPYLRSFWSWLAWALVFPAAALATPFALTRFGPAGTLLTWSVAILLGGGIELAAIRGAGRREAAAGLARAAAGGSAGEPGRPRAPPPRATRAAGAPPPP